MMAVRKPSRIKIIRAKWENLVREPGGKTYRSKSGIVYTARQAKQRQLYELTGKKLSLEAAAKARKQGLLEYPSGHAAGERARKYSVTRAKQRAAKPATIEKLRRRLTPEMTAVNHQGHTYKPGEAVGGTYFEVRERKLQGEFLDMEEWAPMIDIAQGINDPALVLLRKS